MTKPQQGSKTVLITLLLALGLLLLTGGSAQAAKACKEFSKSQCTKNDDCSWISGYTTSKGNKVSAYCRTKPGKGKKSAAGSTKKKASKEETSTASTKSRSSKSTKESAKKKAQTKSKSSKKKSSGKNTDSDQKKATKKKSSKKKSKEKKSTKKKSDSKKSSDK